MTTLTVLGGPERTPTADGIKVPLVEGERLLDTLLRRGLDLPHECGGTGACGSCAIVVRAGIESLALPDEDEQDVLDKSGVLAPGARLACRVAAGRGDLAIVLTRANAQLTSATPRTPGLPIAISRRAAEHLSAMLAGRGETAAVRLAVQPAGCSGHRYSLEYAKAIAADDAVFECHGIRIAVDPQSLPLVQGTTLDVTRDRLSRRLTYDNPNARRICGCGESFDA